MKKTIAWSLLAALVFSVAVIQFLPAPPVVIPALLEADQREAHRLLNFEGIANFRDLGGYTTVDGHRVKWGTLYRSGTLAHASNADLEAMQALQLKTLIDFRSSAEKTEEPNRLPEEKHFQVVEIPTLDDGNKAMVGEIMERIESGDFEGFDPGATMTHANRQFATEFVPQFRQFIETVTAAEGQPVLWHCSAGKDRTGFAAAILLRILGVPQEQVVQDYLASKTHALAARSNQLRMLRLFKGDEAADKLAVLMGVERDWLMAAFTAIDEKWGSFDTYVEQGLGLTPADIEKLRAQLLTAA